MDNNLNQLYPAGTPAPGQFFDPKQAAHMHLHTVDEADKLKRQNVWAEAAELYSKAYTDLGRSTIDDSCAEAERVLNYAKEQAQHCLNMEQIRLQKEANAINSEVETTLRALLARQKDTNETLEELPRQLRRQIESIG